MDAAEAANTRSLGGAKQSQVIQVRGAKIAHLIRAASVIQPGTVTGLELFSPVLHMAEEVVVLSLSAAAIHSVTEVEVLCLHVLILLLQKKNKT